MSPKTYEQRASSHGTVLGRKLLSIMAGKKTNLSLSADVTTCEAVLSLADRCGPYICLLKTHIDILTDFTPSFPRQLRALAQKHNFLIFEDRKFADIGSTVQHQYRDGIYRISSWADVVNAHTVPGEGIIQGLKSVADEHEQFKNDPLDRGLLLLAQMSSKGNLFSEEYTRQSLEMARRYKGFVMGFIAMGQLPGMDKEHRDEDFIVMTPGVSLASKGDGLGQQYQTPEYVIGEKGSDIIIVGRGIFGAGDRVEEVAKEYRDQGWKAYAKRVDL